MEEHHKMHSEHPEHYQSSGPASQEKKPFASASGSGASSTGSSEKFWKTTTVVLIILLAVFVWRGGSVPTPGSDGGTGAVVAAPSAPSAPSGPPADMKALLDDDAVKGDADAPVTIIEWSDYECPFCGRFYTETFGQIEEQYIKTGKVKLVFRDFPLSFHQQAQKAAEAAECAGEQGKYYEMHNLLFEQGVQGGVPGFKGYARQLSLDQAKFDSCLDTGKMAQEVQKDMADGGRAGIQGTPGFLVNGQLISGAQPFSVFQQAIEAALQ